MKEQNEKGINDKNAKLKEGMYEEKPNMPTTSAMMK